jgi:hypothetical protein
MTPGITIPQCLSVPGDPSVCVVAARVTVLLRNQKPGRAAKADGNHWHPSHSTSSRSMSSSNLLSSNPLSLNSLSLNSSCPTSLSDVLSSDLLSCLTLPLSDTLPLLLDRCVCTRFTVMQTLSPVYTWFTVVYNLLRYSPILLSFDIFLESCYHSSLPPLLVPGLLWYIAQIFPYVTCV